VGLEVTRIPEAAYGTATGRAVPLLGIIADVLKSVVIQYSDPVQGLAEGDGDQRTLISSNVLRGPLAESAMCQLETA
jgi:hypothetical protein